MSKADLVFMEKGQKMPSAVMPKGKKTVKKAKKSPKKK